MQWDAVWAAITVKPTQHLHPASDQQSNGALVDQRDVRVERSKVPACLTPKACRRYWPLSCPASYHQFRIVPSALSPTSMVSQSGRYCGHCNSLLSIRTVPSTSFAPSHARAGTMSTAYSIAVTAAWKFQGCQAHGRDQAGNQCFDTTLRSNGIHHIFPVTSIKITRAIRDSGHRDVVQSLYA